MIDKLQNLYTTVRPYLHSDGKNATAVSYISVYRYNEIELVLPETANPYIFLVIDGRLRLHFPEGIYDYLPGEYFISAIDSPRQGELYANVEAHSFIALLVEFSIDDVISVMLDIDGDLPEALFDEKSAIISPPCTDEKIIATLSRLLRMTDTELSFMAKHLKREIIFNLITGPCGRQFMRTIVNIQQAGDIYYINSWIKQNYKVDFSVEELAEQSNMSLSSFHKKFKSAIGMGPLQCQKKLRLMEGRRLMLDKAASVTAAAMEVGYESVSQFIRDYRRMFGCPPQKDIQKIKKCIQIGLMEK